MRITLHGSVRVRREQRFVTLQGRALLTRPMGGMVGVIILLFFQRLLVDDGLDDFSTVRFVMRLRDEVLIEMSSRL